MHSNIVQQHGTIITDDNPSSFRVVKPILNSIRKGNYLKHFCLSLRMSIAAFNSIVFFLLVLFCCLTFAFSFRDSFRIVEKKHSLEYSRQTVKAFYDEFFFLNERTASYAIWDSAYEMIQSYSKERVSQFFQNYFSCSFMDKTSINYIAMYYPNGTLFDYKSCWNLNEINGIVDELVHLHSFYRRNWNVSSTRINSIIIPKQQLNKKTFELEIFDSHNETDHENLSFENILLISGTPIQTMDSSKSTGLIIYGKYLEKESLNEIALRTGHCFTIYNMNDLTDISQLKSDLEIKNSKGKNDTEVLFDYLKLVHFQNIESTLNESESFSMLNTFDSSSFLTQISTVSQYQDRVCPEYNGSTLYFTTEESSESRLNNFHLFRDFLGRAVMVVRTDNIRKNEMIVVSGSVSSYIFFMVLSTIVSLCLQIFFEVGIIRRVSSIQKIIKAVTEENDPTLRIIQSKYGIQENDEIGILGLDLNELFKVLELMQHKLAKDNAMMKNILEIISIEGEKCKAVMNSIQDFILIVDSFSGKVLSLNEAIEKVLDGWGIDYSKGEIMIHNLIRNEKDFTSLEESLLALEYLSENPYCESYTASLMYHLESHKNQQNENEFFGTRNDIRSKRNIPITLSVVKSRIVLSKDSIGNAYIILAKLIP